MIICDKCKQNKKTEIIVFGKNYIEWRFLDNWDLCEECKNEIVEKLEHIIGVPSRKEIEK